MQNRILVAGRTALCAALFAALSGCGDEVDPLAVRAHEKSSGPEAVFQLSPQARANLNLERIPVAGGELAEVRHFPGMVAFRSTDCVQVVSQVDGVVQELGCKLGDEVEQGQPLLVLASRELAQARSAWLTAGRSLELAAHLLESERSLWQSGATSQESLLAAEFRMQEAELARQAAAGELHSLGLSVEDLEASEQRLAGRGDEETLTTLNRLPFAAPRAGAVVQLGVSQGQAVATGQTLLEVADGKRVWVDCHLPAQDLARLMPGDTLQVRWPAGHIEAPATIVYLAPEVDPGKQTALVRLELDNRDGLWRPGLFVEVEAHLDNRAARVLLPMRALARYRSGGDTALVFVELGEGKFEAREVRLDRVTPEQVSVASGLEPGETVVAGDTLLLRSAWQGEGGAEE
ncbi:MAG: efflux RND transporter periplasmic adaptor subunit [Planctomycetota bacterium]